MPEREILRKKIIVLNRPLDISQFDVSDDIENIEKEYKRYAANIKLKRKLTDKLELFQEYDQELYFNERETSGDMKIRCDAYLSLLQKVVIYKLIKHLLIISKDMNISLVVEDSVYRQKFIEEMFSAVRSEVNLFLALVKIDQQIDI